MNVLGNIAVGFDALATNKARSLLTMLGILFGVASMIATIAIGAGAQARIEQEIRSIGSNLIVVTTGSAQSGGARMGTGSLPTLNEGDASAIEDQLDDVVVAAPSLRGNGQIVRGNINWTTLVLGMTPEYLIAREWPVADGRGIEPEDVESGRKVAMIGQSVAERFFAEEDPIGQFIRIDRVPFVIVGLLDRKGQSLGGQDQDDIVMLPLSTARNRVLGRTLSAVRSITAITIKIVDGGDMQAAEVAIIDVLRDRHKLRETQEDDFTVRNAAEILDTKEKSSRVMTLMLALIASISLLVGGVGIMNIMLASVAERMREIGLRMAVGARSWDIQMQFLSEAVAISLAGALCGILLGLACTTAVSELAGFRVRISIEAIVIAVTFAVVVGLLFGLVPARKAGRLQPIEALRHD